MRILLIHNFYKYRGGEDTYFYALQDLLRKKGHSVTTYIKKSSSIKTPVDYLKTAFLLFWNPKVEKELEEIITKISPDVVHFHNIFPLIGPGAYKIFKRNGIRTVQTIHNYRLFCPGGTLSNNGIPCPHSQKKFLLSKLFSKCYHNSRLATFLIYCSILIHRQVKSFDDIDAFVFPTEFTKNYYKNRFFIPENKINLLPYFTRELRDKNSKVKRKNYFLFAGRLSSEKGIMTLLEIFSTLPKINLIVIGDGPLAESINKYNKYKNIAIKPFSKNKIKLFSYMKNALYTIVPSTWYEILPNVVIESFLNKTPVVGPRIAAFREVIHEKKRGLLFKFGDKNDLKKTIITGWRKKSDAVTMGNSAYQYYKVYFTPEIHYKKLIKLYENI